MKKKVSLFIVFIILACSTMFTVRSVSAKNAPEKEAVEDDDSKQIPEEEVAL